MTHQSEIERPRLRRVAIALLTIPIGIVTAAILLIAITTETEEEQFGAAVRQAGGRFLAHDHRTFLDKCLGSPANSFYMVHLEGTAVKDAWLAENCHRLRRTNQASIFLSNTPVTDVGIRSLAGMNEVVYLSLRGTEVTDAAIPTLLTLTNLISLDVAHTNITDGGLSQFAAAQTPQSLTVDSRQATPQLFSALRSHPRIVGIGLVDATDETIAVAASLPQLQIATVEGSLYSATGLSPLIAHGKLKHISLIDDDLTDVEYAFVAKKFSSRGGMRRSTTAEQKRVMQQYLNDN